MSVTTVPPVDHERPTASPEPAGVDAPSAARVAASLARREARLLLRNPAFLGGIGLTLFLFWLTGTEPVDLREFSTMVVLVMVPFAWMTLIATNLGALRTRRHGTDELFDTLPASMRSRTAGLCLATLATVPVTVILVLAALVHVTLPGDASGTLLVWEMAAAVPIVVGGGVVGIAVARWLPSTFAIVPAVFVTIQIEVWLADSLSSRWRWLSFWVDPDHSGLTAFDIRPSAWHLVWLAAWVVIMAIVAVARHERDRVVFAALVVAGLAAAVAGWAQIRPIGGERADELVSMLTEPDQHQVCEVRSRVTYCAYEEYASLIDTWDGVVRAVLAHAPDDGRDLRVMQRAATIIGSPDCSPMDFLSSIPADIAERVDRAAVWRPDGAVHPPLSPFEQMPCSDDDDVGWAHTAVQVGAWAVGLPPAPAAGDARCTADGQARAAIAVWLGTRAGPTARTAIERITTATPRDRAGRLDFLGEDTPFADAWDTPPQWGVRWHGRDVLAAQRMAALPADVVADVLAAHWTELTDPATPTSRLLELLELSHHSSFAPSGDCPDLRET